MPSIPKWQARAIGAIVASLIWPLLVGYAIIVISSAKRIAAEDDYAAAYMQADGEAHREVALAGASTVAYGTLKDAMESVQGAPQFNAWRQLNIRETSPTPQPDVPAQRSDRMTTVEKLSKRAGS